MTGGRFSRGAEDSGDNAPPEHAPLGGTRTEATQRLQIGLAGLGSMILLIGLASALGNQADRTEELAVPEAAPTTEPTESAPQRDPLADAGIVPEIPADPAPGSGDGQVSDLPDPVVEDSTPTSNAQD
ncbi:hypothetical protein [Qipengyuania nanhaisediminis]|uniref:hypothetical protein n=1 Tax=Qipengyuania nanhaisediminis TaxID=604088 RepID=UPI0038B31988